MKKLPIKYCQMLCFWTGLMFGSPFFKIPGGILDNGYQSYDRLTGIDFTYEYIAAYFGNGNLNPNKNLAIIAFTVAIVMLMQLVAALIKRERLIISTAGVMLFITVAGLVYLMQANLPVEVKWGYYAFMAVQLAIAIFTPISPAPIKPGANQS